MFGVLWEKKLKKFKTKIRINYFDTVTILNVSYKFPGIREGFIKNIRAGMSKNLLKKNKWLNFPFCGLFTF